MGGGGGGSPPRVTRWTLDPFLDSAPKSPERANSLLDETDDAVEIRR